MECSKFLLFWLRNLGFLLQILTCLCLVVAIVQPVEGRRRGKENGHSGSQKLANGYMPLIKKAGPGANELVKMHMPLMGKGHSGDNELVARHRPLKEKSHSRANYDGFVIRKDDNERDTFPAWNITGTYRGTWRLVNSSNNSSRIPNFRKSSGNYVLELVTTPTHVNDVHHVKGVLLFIDVLDNKQEVGDGIIRVEGEYLWPSRQLRVVAISEMEGENGKEGGYMLSNTYHSHGILSSWLFCESLQAPLYDLERRCNTKFVAKISEVLLELIGENHVCYNLEGLMISHSWDDDGDCIQPMLLSATTFDLVGYKHKVLYYSLMVAFISLLQYLLYAGQMDYSSTHLTTARVSTMTIGQQAIIGAYLGLFLLAKGLLFRSLFGVFAIGLTCQYVVFSTREITYLTAIWKESRQTNNRERWEATSHEFSKLHLPFYGILLGGICITLVFQKSLRFIVLLGHSFWVPQIIANVVRNSRKPLQPRYILGMSIIRLTVPLYIFGCPHNFIGTKPDKNWCICLVVFMGMQASVLLLQSYLGSRCFIPRQMLPGRYGYHRRFGQDSDRTECAICMNSVDITHHSNDCMVTPCDHFFHYRCLRRWMGIKMECPTCRRTFSAS